MALSLLITGLSTFLAMLALYKIFVPTDVFTIPRWLLLTYLSYAVVYLLFDHSLASTGINFIIDPAAIYCISLLTLRSQFHKPE